MNACIFFPRTSSTGKGEAKRRQAGRFTRSQNGRTEKQRGSRGGLSAGRIAAIGGDEARGRAHGTVSRNAVTVRVGHTLP